MDVDALAIGAHPDDVDMICGGTVAKLVALGRTVVIADLTRGEMGTRGSPELRSKEAHAAAKVLGVKERVILDLCDGCIENTTDSRQQVIELIRRYRPTLVLTHYWDDLHPDHRIAGEIMRSVMYPAGFANYPAAGEPFRPNEVLFFMGHTPFQPSFVVDIDGFHEQKMAAIRCFASQFHQEGSSELPTEIASPDFLTRLETRARYFGSLIGRTFGEPFLVTRTVPMSDPVEHYHPFQKVYSSKMWDGQAPNRGS